MFDVAIIGSGPVGSHLACRMAELGYGVAVLDRGKQAGEKISCTGIISQECVSSFAIPDDVILRRVNSASLFSPSGGLLRLHREETQAYILDRAAFDRNLASRAWDKGAEYIFETSVSKIAIEDDGVSVVTSRQQQEAILKARIAIIAAGFGSRLSEQTGLGSFKDFVMGAQAEVTTTGIEEVEVYFGREIAPGFFGWLVPTSSQTARVGLLSRQNPGLYFRKLLESLKAQGKIASAKAMASYGGIPLKPLPKTCGERLIVVGDAAGQVKPTTGGGIYYGLLCADIAATVLHEALKSDDLSAGNLAEYERRWRKKLGRELKIGYWARKIFERLSDRQIDRLFKTVTSKGIDEKLLKEKGLSFDWHGKAILRLLGHSMVARAVNLVKFPFKTG